MIQIATAFASAVRSVFLAYPSALTGENDDIG